jgi:hypothetical protein
VCFPGTVDSEILTQVGVGQIPQDADGAPGSVFPEPGDGEMVVRVMKGDVDQVAFQGGGRSYGFIGHLKLYGTLVYIFSAFKVFFVFLDFRAFVINDLNLIRFVRVRIYTFMVTANGFETVPATIPQPRKDPEPRGRA